MTPIAVLLYNLTLVAGTAYLVALHGWSGWWFLLTLLLMMNYNKNDEK
jgi:hypothetical protein